MGVNLILAEQAVIGASTPWGRSQQFERSIPNKQNKQNKYTKRMSLLDGSEGLDVWQHTSRLWRNFVVLF